MENGLFVFEFPLMKSIRMRTERSSSPAGFSLMMDERGCLTKASLRTVDIAIAARLGISSRMVVSPSLRVKTGP